MGPRRRFLLVMVAGAIAAAAAAAERFPKPDPASSFPELKIIGADGRAWRAAQEDWTGARARVASDPAWRKWLAGERRAVDAWMRKYRDRVEWRAGWSHDGVSPRDGSRLDWTPSIPGEDVKFLHSASDKQVALTPKLMAWWVVTFRVRHVEMLVRAARLWKLTGEERYGRWTREQMDFYADNFECWPPAKDGARLFGQTLTEATSLIQLAEVVRLLGDSVPADQRWRWQHNFFAPEVALLSQSWRAIHNIATWQRCAAAQVALLFGDEAQWCEAIDGSYGVRQLLADGVTSDYLWYEQSISYNAYVVQALLTLFKAASMAGRLGELEPELALAEDLMLSPTYLRFPDGHLPTPADGPAPQTAPNRALFRDAYRIFPTTLGLELARKERGWDALLDPPAPGSGVTAALPSVVSRNLESSRMAVLRQGDWQVFFHYGQLAASHAQAEALNFSAYFRGIDITHDTGTTRYGSALHAGYFSRAPNHNVPLVDGEGEDLSPLRQPGATKVPLTTAAGQLEAFSDARVVATQPGFRPNASARRTLAIEGNGLDDVVELRTTDAKSHALGLMLHLQGKVHLASGWEPDPAFASARGGPFGYWRDARARSARDRFEFEVDYAGVRMRVALHCAGEFRVWHGRTPDIPPAYRESVYVETTGETATFTTRIEAVK